MSEKRDSVLLRARGISKSFPGVRALDGVDFALRAAEVHAIVGENGAGKSTLIKILSGVYHADSGEVEIEGRQVRIGSAAMALQMGIAYIPQELSVVPSLTVAENIMLGVEPTVGPIRVVQGSELRAQAKATLDQLGMDLDPGLAVERLSLAQSQMVTIARALARKCRIVIMDEPTAPLSEQEVEHLFALIRRLKTQGISFIYISHRMQEIFDIADRVTVLRDGRWIGSLEIADADIPTIIKMMVGRPVSELFPERREEPGAEVLRVESMSRAGALSDIDFSLREGEILGIAGLLGSGRTELMRAIFGLDPLDRGRIYLQGRLVDVGAPRTAVALGMAFVPEERKSEGLFMEMSVKHNISISVIRDMARGPFIDLPGENSLAASMVEELSIDCPSADSLVVNLSGGNQQKVVVARWLGRPIKVLLLDDPTRGIDVGAKAEVHRLIARLADEGIGILFTSSDLGELIGICDRVVVLREGRLVGEFGRSEATQHNVLAAAMDYESGASPETGAVE